MWCFDFDKAGRALVAIVLLLSGPGPRRLSAQVPLPTPSAPPLGFLGQVNGPWSGTGAVGGQVVNIGDVNGDGCDDIVATASDHITGTPAAQTLTEIRCFSGLTGGTIWNVVGPGPVGVTVAGALGTIGDINLDGFEDIAATGGMVFPTGPFFLTTYSGLDGSILYSIPAPLQLISICRLEDQTGDGIPEFAVGDLTFQVAGIVVGAVKILDGATGATVQQIPGPAPGLSFGSKVTGLGDINGDGLTDLSVLSNAAPTGQANYTSNVTLLLSDPVNGYQTGSVLTETSYGSLFVLGLDDVDGDGTQDILLVRGYASSPPPGTPPGAGTCELLSGATGSTLWLQPRPDGLSQFATMPGLIAENASAHDLVATLFDVDGDGIRDFAVTGRVDPSFAPAQSVDQLVVMVFSGHDGTLLFQVQENAAPSNFGAALAGGDFDGDGLGDLAVGAPQGLLFAGFVRTYRGRPLMEPTVARGSALDFAGNPQDILFLAPQGQSPGSGGPARSVVIPTGTPTQVWLARPPLAPAIPLPHAVFGVVRSGGNYGVFGLPFGGGALCFTPEIFDPLGDPTLFTLTNTFGGFPALLPANHAVFGGLGSPVALMGAIPFPITFWLQGIVANPSLPFPGLTVTNALRVLVR